MSPSRRLLAGALAATLAGPAAAHGSVAGHDGLVAGLLHPLTEPAQLVALVALGLALGQRGLQQAKPALAALVLAAVGGAVLAALGLGGAGPVPSEPVLAVALLALALLLGLGVALARPLPPAALAAAAVLVALGCVFGSVPEGEGRAVALGLAGSAIGIVWWTVDVAAIVFELRRPWLRTGVRVVGSWAAAASLIVLTFSWVQRA